MTLRTIQRHGPNMQRSGQECQSPPGVESGSGQEGLQERLLPVHQQQKKKQRKHGPSAEWDWGLVTKNVERLRCSKFSLPRSLLVRLVFRSPRLLKPVRKSGPRKTLLLVKEDQVREHLNKLDIHKSMRPEQMHP